MSSFVFPAGGWTAAAARIVVHRHFTFVAPARRADEMVLDDDRVIVICIVRS